MSVGSAVVGWGSDGGDFVRRGVLAVVVFRLSAETAAGGRREESRRTWPGGRAREWRSGKAAAIEDGVSFFSAVEDEILLTVRGGARDRALLRMDC